MANQVLRNHRTFNGTRREAVAAAATKAAHVVEQTASGVQPNSTDAAALNSVLIAEDARGRGYVAGDEYAADEVVPYLDCNAGDLVTLLLADTESVTGPDDGTPTALVPNASGGVRAAAGDGTESDAIIAVADETLNNTSGSPSLVDAKVTR